MPPAFPVPPDPAQTPLLALTPETAHDFNHPETAPEGFILPEALSAPALPSALPHPESAESPESPTLGTGAAYTKESQLYPQLHHPPSLTPMSKLCHTSEERRASGNNWVDSSTCQPSTFAQVEENLLIVRLCFNYISAELEVQLWRWWGRTCQLTHLIHPVPVCG